MSELFRFGDIKCYSSLESQRHYDEVYLSKNIGKGNIFRDQGVYEKISRGFKSSFASCADIWCARSLEKLEKRVGTQEIFIKPSLYET